MFTQEVFDEIVIFTLKFLGLNKVYMPADLTEFKKEVFSGNRDFVHFSLLFEPCPNFFIEIILGVHGNLKGQVVFFLASSEELEDEMRAWATVLTYAFPEVHKFVSYVKNEKQLKELISKMEELYILSKQKLASIG